MSEQPITKDPTELVDMLADPERWWQAFTALNELGQVALPAVHDGLGQGKWQVRRWCAALLDHHANAESLELLIPLLRDPKNLVRLWAVHSISCDRCKDGENPIDVVPLLVERIRVDESIRVRRMAAAMLVTRDPELRTAHAFQAILQDETDRKMRVHAERGLSRCRVAGVVS